MLQIVQSVYDDFIRWFDRLSKLLCSYAMDVMKEEVLQYQSFFAKSLDQYKAIEDSLFALLHVIRKVAPVLNRRVPDLSPLPLLPLR